MKTRLELQTLLEDLLGSRQVYHQPPASVKMQYPAIVYYRKDIDSRKADDISYMQTPVYELTVIDKNPDSEIPIQISQLPMCSYDRHYTSDNLNHDVFTIYF